MKLIILCIALSGAPVLMAETSTQEMSNARYDDKNQVDSDLDIPDSFDDLLDAPMPPSMIVTQRPVSWLEACLKHIGVDILMKYIAFRVWLEDQWCGSTTKPSA
jgi:hypothetical protein